ncbi:bacteriophage holin [Lactococcus cremoris]|nr:bacteriophage holin [Lactococcus cremoris]
MIRVNINTPKRLILWALFLCYNIVGMFVRFHPIPRVKPFFGVAFFIY